MIESEKRPAPFLHEATNSGPAVLILLTSSGHAHVDYLLPCATEIKKTVKKKNQYFKKNKVERKHCQFYPNGLFWLSSHPKHITGQCPCNFILFSLGTFIIF